MKIRDFKYKPEDVECRYCTSFIHNRCQSSNCPWLKERVEAGVIGYHEAIEELLAEYKLLRQRLKIVSVCSQSFWRDDAHRKRFAVAQAIFGFYRKRNTPAYYAALYLLTSDESLFIRTVDCIRKKNIDFQYADIRNMTENQYALFKTAKSLYNESGEVSVDEFADPVLFELDSFRVAVNAMLISRCGLSAVYLIQEDMTNGSMSS